MIEYDALKVGDRLRIVGVGAPGFAKLGDIVTVEKVGPNRCDVVHSVTGERVYFALTCGAARLEQEFQPVIDELRLRMRAGHGLESSPQFAHGTGATTDANAVAPVPERGTEGTTRAKSLSSSNLPLPAAPVTPEDETGVD